MTLGERQGQQGGYGWRIASQTSVNAHGFIVYNQHEFKHKKRGALHLLIVLFHIHSQQVSGWL